MKLFLLTSFALVAFAFNSILCRMALGRGETDAASFTVIRLVSGAAVLALVAYSFNKTRNPLKTGHWLSAFFLFSYAIFFSFAYLGLPAATGALILFGCVQLTMILAVLFGGRRLGRVEWLGLATALGGLVYLVFPGLAAPPFWSSFLMAAAGAAWGFYTLRGRGGANPLTETAGNFVLSVPMVIAASLPFFSAFQISTRGVVLSVLSGAIASGLGYTVWYAALKHLTSTRAAVLQLSVPVIAAAGGVVFLAETADLRLLIAAALILGGIGLTIAGKDKH